MLSSETLLNMMLPLLPNLPPDGSIESSTGTSFPLWPVGGRPEIAQKDPTDRDTRAVQPA